MKKYLILILILGVSTGIFGAISQKKQKEAQVYFRTGLKSYLQRDFKKASEEWQKTLAIDANNKKAKDYLNKAQGKYYKALELYYQGVDSFGNKDFSKAEDQFKQSLLINPLDKKAKYYIKLCQFPKLDLSTEKSFFAAKNGNRFVLKLDKSDTTKRWEESWQLDIFDGDTIIKTIKNSGELPKSIDWNSDDNKGKIIKKEGSLKAVVNLKSFFGRDFESEAFSIKIDNIGPTVNVEAEDMFFPDNEAKDNVIHFKVEGKDKGSGVAKLIVEIYDKDKTKLLKKIESQEDQDRLKINWSGDLEDGSKLAGGSTVYYRVVSVDKVGNKSKTEFKKIDANITLKKEDKGLVMNLPNIEFAFGRANLRKSSFSILDKVGEILNQYSNAKFVIEGHTDNVGDQERNLKLSEKRAKSVYKYLVSKFKISKDRVDLKGYGDSRPIAPNDTEAGRAKNRRVEIVIVSQ